MMEDVQQSRHDRLVRYAKILEERGIFKQYRSQSEFARLFSVSRQYVAYLRQQEVRPNGHATGEAER